MKIILKKVKSFLDVPHPLPSVHFLSPLILQINIKADAFYERSLFPSFHLNMLVHQAKYALLSMLRVYVHRINPMYHPTKRKIHLKVYHYHPDYIAFV